MIIIHFILMLLFSKTTFSQIYVFDVKDHTTYSYDCGTQTSSFWGVKNDSCSLTTSSIMINEGCSANGSIVIPVNLKINQTGQLSCTDTAWVEYTTDGGVTWVGLDTIIGCEQSANTQYNYYPEIPNNSYLMIKVTFDNGAPNDWWQIMDGDIVVNEPCFLLSLEDNNTSCGTEDEELKLPIRTYKSPFDSVEVPIRIYVYKDIFSSNQIYNEFEKVKEHFQGTDIKISIDSYIHIIDDEKYYNYKKSQQDELLESLYDSSVINLYIFPSVETTKDVLGYTYINGPNAIFMSYSGFINRSTLTHEIGHKLGLLHTHAFGDELVDGSNCDVAGDRICDTPADPQLSGKVESCGYVGNDLDLNGNHYNPDVSNIMSYSLTNCRTNFTYGQIEVMKNVIANMNLSTIKNNLSYVDTPVHYETHYYDLYGRKINGPIKNNIYFEVNGDEVTKNIIF